MQDSATTLETVFSHNLIRSDVEVQICLASCKDESPDFQRLNVTADVTTHFRGIAAQWIDKHKRNYDKGDLLLKAFEAQTKPDDHELEFIKLSDHEGIKEQISSLSDQSGLDPFAADETFVDNLRFYTVVIIPREKNAKPIKLFRFYSPKKELSRSKMYGIFMKNGQYDKVDEGLFLFDSLFDCFVSDDILYIVNKDAFQKIFRFYEMLKAAAKETLDTIEEHIPIANFQLFSSACEGHLQKLAKLKNIASKPYIKTLTITDLKNVIARYKLPVTTVGEGDDEKLEYDPKDKWAILRLLDDDYLESYMTGNHYEVNSKRTMDS